MSRSTVPDPRRRLVALLVVMGLAFAAVLARLTVVQGTASSGYAALGQSQRERKIVLPARRGSILDRNGVELAMTVQQKTVWANPRLVRDPAGEAAALAPVLNVDVNDLRDRLSGNGAFAYLARKVTDDVAAKVAALNLPGVAFIDEPKRFDPAGPLGLSLLGAVGLDNQGLSGLELQYEKQLVGRPGALVVERDPHGTEIASGIRQERPSAPGDNLMLTIDRSMQYETERALSGEIEAAKAKGGIAIVMDPRTGEVLAMANLVAGVNGQPPQPAPSNLAVTNVYEPGSVNKLITVSAALEEGVIKPDDKLIVPDQMMVANHRFSDHDPHPTGEWSITDIVANSSNIGTIMIGQKLGKDRLDKYLRAYGLGAHSGLGFPGESAGLLLDPKDWSGTSIGTVPIGQGLAVTALQMLEAYNTVANGGTFVPARLVQSVVDASGVRHPISSGPSRRVISTRTAQQMTAMLSEVVRVGTGTSARIDGYTVAGKTGTAKKPVNGSYNNGLYEASFAGFVPAEAPRLSSIVIIDEPGTAIYGGTVAAPVFADVARYGLRRFQIPPPPVALNVAVPPASTDAIKADAGADLPPVTPAPDAPAPATTLPAATPTTKP
ncbi:MAG: peptidoglycan synthetase FtsI [Acidimicrobiales bacterium]|nr:peptidoglycan synthetase FtsI [Acidimicrobiales bacterium]